MVDRNTEKEVAATAEGSVAGVAELEALQERIGCLLPRNYRDFALVSTSSMGSADMKFDGNARVAWDEIWTKFCDLAMGGGPPHRGTFLEAVTAQEVANEPAGYQLVRAELARGIQLTTALTVLPDDEPGWILVRCDNKEMASWFLRAILAENVFVRQREDTLALPAGPTFRLVKEIKNVIVALAKTCHYWRCHFSPEDRAIAAQTLQHQEVAGSLLVPASRPEVLARVEEYRQASASLRAAIEKRTPVRTLKSRAVGWVGIALVGEQNAAWLVRAAIAEGMLARREQDVLYLPLPIPEQLDRLSEIAERWQQLFSLWNQYRLERQTATGTAC